MLVRALDIMREGEKVPLRIPLRRLDFVRNTSTNPAVQHGGLGANTSGVACAQWFGPHPASQVCWRLLSLGVALSAMPSVRGHYEDAERLLKEAVVAVRPTHIGDCAGSSGRGS